MSVNLILNLGVHMRVNISVIMSVNMCGGIPFEKKSARFPFWKQNPSL